MGDNIEFKKLENYKIPDDAYVTVTTMNHIIEIQYMERQNHCSYITKLDKDTYVLNETGEIKEFQHIENRFDSFNSLRQSFKKLRYLINNNFTGKGNELHITLTYRQRDNYEIEPIPMTDTKKLYKDFEKFMKKLRYYYRVDKKNKNSIQTTIDYLPVPEPQDSGSWHVHALIRFNDVKKIYIQNELIRDMWGNGWVTIKSLKNVDNVGAYLSAYLTDLELTENTKMSDITYKKNGATFMYGELETKQTIIDEKIVEKKVVKGARLKLYPPNFKIIRGSSGIVPPDREPMLYKEVKKNIVKSAKPHYTKGISMTSVREGEDIEEPYSNTLIYEQYNLKRK